MVAVAIRPSIPRDVRMALGLSRERMARLLDVSAKTIERWEEAGGPPPKPEHRARLGELVEIVELGRIVYPGDGLRLFLTTPLPAFGGRTALQAVEAGRAADVLGALAGDYEGLGH
jgi:transcriptional regulator with XRE-family HTH domain